MADLIPQNFLNEVVGFRADIARANAESAEWRRMAAAYAPGAVASAERASMGAQQVGQNAPGFVQGVQGVGTGLGQLGTGVGRAGQGLSDVGASARYASDTVRETRERAVSAFKTVAAVGAGVALAAVGAAFVFGDRKKNGARRAAGKEGHREVQQARPHAPRGAEVRPRSAGPLRRRVGVSGGRDRRGRGR